MTGNGHFPPVEIAKRIFLDAAKFLIIGQCYLYERRIFTECTAMVRENGQYFFVSSYAQTWWRQQSPGNLTFPQARVEDEITGIDPANNLKEL